MTRVREFPLPDLGEGLTEGEILSWLVAEGDLVALNQPIVEVETAKAAVEIPAKWAGRIIKIYQPAGSTIEVGTLIVAIDTTPDAGPLTEEPAPAPTPAPAAGPERTPVLVGYGPRSGGPVRRERRVDAPAAVPAALAPVAPAPVVPAPVVPEPVVRVPAPGAVGPALAKPPVRLLARDLGVDLHRLAGTGPAGDITRDDVRAAAAATAAPASTPTRTAPAWGPDREQRVPVKGVRKLTAENMVASAFTAPHVSEFLTVDVTRTVRAMERLREQPAWRGIKISPLLFAAKAVLLAIARNPMINSTWSAGPAGDEIIVKQYVNLGIAAATPRGLVVPNIKDAGRLSLRELAEALVELSATAKAGRTAPADMTGGTFTITNVGMFGVDTGTPILPPGEAAILCLGAVRELPWVHRGKVRPRMVTTLGTSFDHRIIDGEVGSLFLRDVGAFLNDPATGLLLEA